MKINTIKVAVLMALGLVGINELNAQAVDYQIRGNAGVVIASNADNIGEREPIVFQVGRFDRQNHLKNYRLKIDKEKSTFNTNLAVYGDLFVSKKFNTSDVEVYNNIKFTGGAFAGGGRLESEGTLNLKSGIRELGLTGVKDYDNDKIVFINGRNKEIAKLKDGAFTLNELSTIETPGSLKLQPGISNKEDDVIAFLNSENSEMARVKDGTFTVKGGNTFQSYGNLSLRANANGKQNGTIFFKDGSNREMARLERGKLTLDQISLNVTTFPDYVFAKEYHLMPLNEVASYIKENKHLPNMPTEKEVVKEGMNVGQINTLLVEKVEELTLYTIEQEEKIQAQEKTMKALLQKLEALETLVKSKK
ncbi:hypothetical protein [Tenacibaculum maritimum]|uniref:hypothetical protein n=1 Tax=Tenacibaculum maritimum TaxID=107401 RepID=UPI001E433170|nr:hypothetical protein [Tenacibaculum maritimum]MCD9562936.1 hypothetical protein [Tenacibaculum maritimum]MCD9565503.1 hypothetical protein [Tenacibaculum maritimum]MCD9578039.1 hypothetical protein [Tenacibaculum maritimum]MCD9595981.1 hypothetical protein [Tenacibaculum maritimum]MCD9614210.1 hypothetical protein [Tenacibaculum maritimum]